MFGAIDGIFWMCMRFQGNKLLERRGNEVEDVDWVKHPTPARHFKRIYRGPPVQGRPRRALRWTRIAVTFKCSAGTKLRDPAATLEAIPQSHRRRCAYDQLFNRPTQFAVGLST
jgi:hypothetical protein